MQTDLPCRRFRGGHPLALPAGISGCLAVLGGTAGLAQNVADDWTRNFRLGAQTMFNVKADFSVSGTVPVSRPPPGPVGVPGADHFYDDGFVRVDQTGNAGGTTSFWGYQSGSQVDAANDRIVMKSVRSFQASEDTTVNSGFSPGLDTAYGSQIRDWGRTRLGWEVGYAFTPFDFKDETPLAATVTRDVQAFSYGGIALPPAPFAGGPSGVGPAIGDVSTALADEVLGATITGTRQLDVNLHALRAGVTLFWRFQPRWALSGSLGPAMGLVPGTYRYEDTFAMADGTTATESGSSSKTEVVFGGYASATLLCRVTHSADVYLGTQFMGLQSASFGSAQRQAELNLGATFTLSLGVNWPF
ncbi:MAG: hypothetical protein KF791_05250 [Verrucomicrobiae bacterium]|nr:hypothetical protein [Verrucomicrobiae bacterium]